MVYACVAQAIDVDDDGDTVDALDQDFRYMSGGGGDGGEMGDSGTAAGFGVASRRVFVGGGAGTAEEDALEGLGELAQLTVTNEADSAYDVRPRLITHIMFSSIRGGPKVGWMNDGAKVIAEGGHWEQRSSVR